MTALAVTAACCFGWFMLARPPIAVLAAVAHWYGLPDITSYGPTSSILARARFQGRRALVSWLDYGMAYAIRRRLPDLAERPDVQRLTADLASLDGLIASQLEVPHLPLQWSVWVGGIGFCDQVNGAVARVLAGRYAHVQAYSVFNQGHTFGRVWSAHAHDWIYFDVWPHGYSVFTIGAKGDVQIASRPRTSSGPHLDSLLLRSYGGTREGLVLNEFQPTFVSQLIAKTVGSVGRPRNVRDEARRAIVPNIDSIGTGQEVGPAELADSLIDARFRYLFGDSGLALRQLQRIGHRPDAWHTIVGTVAAFFGGDTATLRQ